MKQLKDKIPGLIKTIIFQRDTELINQSENMHTYRRDQKVANAMKKNK